MIGRERILGGKKVVEVADDECILGCKQCTFNFKRTPLAGDGCELEDFAQEENGCSIRFSHYVEVTG